MSETRGFEVKSESQPPPELKRPASPPPRYDPSAERQKLYRLATEFSQILRSFCEHERLLKGSLKTLRRRCGHPGCRCLRGQLHQTLVFVDRGASKRTIRKLDTAQFSALRTPVEKYRSLRRLRVRLGRLHREVLACCDRLSAYRLKEGRRTLAGRIP